MKAKAILILILSLFTIQSCDLTKQSASTVNPYKLEAQKAFGEISEAVFGNIKNHLDEASLITHEDILNHAKEGYMRWANKYSYKNSSFERGLNFSQAFYYGAQSKQTSKQFKSEKVDSVLNEASFTYQQQNYIKQLPFVLESSSNLAELERNLEEFDREVIENLDVEEREVVLVMSAVFYASFEFIFTNGRLLDTLAGLLEGNNQQSMIFDFFPKRMNNDIKYLVQSTTDPKTLPPDIEDYINPYELGAAIVGGAVTGAGFIGGIGSGIAGPPGAVIGGFIGGIFGGFFGGGFYYGAGTREYERALEKWCGITANKSHPDWAVLCEEYKDNDHN